MIGIIKEKGLEKLACRLYDVLGNILKRIDLETYGLFKIIRLKEGKELEAAVSDTSQEDQVAVQDLGKQFFEVFQV